MSRQLHFPIAMNDDPVTLHTVLPGTTVCAVCGASMLAMRFRYTDRPDLLERMTEMSDGSAFGMIDPVDGCVRPVVACTTPQTEAAKPQRVGSEGLSHLVANMVHAAWHNVYGNGDPEADEDECGGATFVKRLHQVAVYNSWSAEDVAAVVSVCVAISQTERGVSMQLMREATEFIPGLWGHSSEMLAKYRDAESMVVSKVDFFDILDSYMTKVITQHEMVAPHAAPGALQ